MRWRPTSVEAIEMALIEEPMPAVVDLTTAAGMLGIGRTLAYRLVRTGQWPTPLIRVGRLIKVPTQPLLDLLHGAA